MTAPLRAAGDPSPIAAGTHDDDTLPPPIPFDAAAAGKPEIGPVTAAILGQGAFVTGTALDYGQAAQEGEAIDLGAGAPPWLTYALRSIRPVCVGALMAIPTLGSLSVGLVAIVSPSRAMAMVAASTAYLAGIPGEIVILIGTLATGYTVAKTVERIQGKQS